MRALSTKKPARLSSSLARIVSASHAVLEPMEKRMMMSTTLAGWNFDTYTTSTVPTTNVGVQSPPPTSGTVSNATAYTVGMANQSNTTVPSVGPETYLYPTPNAAAAYDDSSYLLATGSADTGANGGSEGGTNGYVWYVEKGQTNLAPIGSQGVQFNVPTSGYNQIALSFDMNPSSAKAEAQFIVEVTTDIQDPAPVWTNVTQYLTFGPGDIPDSGNAEVPQTTETVNGSSVTGYVATVGTSKTYGSSNTPTDIWLQSNTPGTSGYSANIASGTYATIQGPLIGTNTAWLNDLQVDLSVSNGLTSVDNAPGFAFRVVNAATGAQETNIDEPSPVGFKNWRFNDIEVTAAGTATNAAPTVLSQPQPVTVSSGAAASFTSTASGYPTPSEQWQVSLDGGHTFQNVNSTLVPNSGNAFNTSTFTISSTTAAESADEFRAVFNNGIGGDSSNNVYSNSASLTVNQLFAPTVTGNPSNVTTNGTNTVSFTAAASGNPTPTVQWQYEPTNGTSYTNISSGTTFNQSTYTFTASASNAGSYRALFTNSLGSVNSSAATLTVYSTPTVLTSPASQTISVPNSVTFTAKALAEVVPTVTWQYEPKGASAFINCSSGSASVANGVAVYNTTTGSASFTFTPVLIDNGDQFRILVADGSGASVPSAAATLTVQGEVIADWTFATAPSGTVINNPSPDFGNGTLTALGMQNDYNPGTASVGPEDDVIATPGTTDSSFNENLWRIRGGASATTAGSPEGWSSFAPEYTQGAEMQVPTTGYNDILLHFDWFGTTKCPQNAEILYTTDGTTWQTYNFNGTPYLINPGNDYYGSTNAATPPTGVTVDFSSIPAVNNNPSFAVEFVSAYQPTNYTAAELANPSLNTNNALPEIYDGNGLITDSNGNPVAHGQYATAASNDTAYAFGSQEIEIGGQNDSGTFTLTVPTANGGHVTTAPITYDNAYTVTGTTYTSTMATNIQNALDAVLPSGTASVTFNDGMSSNFIIQFSANQAQGAITANTSNLTGTYFPAEDNAAYGESGEPSVNTIYAGNIVPYSLAGSGNWRIGNIDFTGNSGAPNVYLEPKSQTVELTAAAPSQSVTFTSDFYSSTASVTVQWEVNTGDGTGFNPVASGGTTLTAISGSPNDYTSSYTFTANNVNQTGYQFLAVFTNTANASSANSSTATLLVVQPTAPSIQTQPVNTSEVAGNTATLTAVLSGLPLDSVNATTTWQQNNGSGWTNLSTGVANTYTTLASGYISETSTLTLTTTLAENGYNYRCIVTNSVGTATSNSATLTVVPVEQTVTQWNFGGSSPSGVVAAGVGASTAPPYAGGANTPIPNITIAPGSLTTVGMVDSNFSPPSVPAADITLTQGTADANYAVNTWRIRGGETPSTPGANGINGWDQAAAQYTQGAEIDVNAANLQDVYLTFQWFATTNSIRDLQVQYCLNTTAGTETWTNLGSALIANPNDYYGANGASAPTGVVANLTGIAGVNGDTHLGLRLVSAYDPGLSNQYASASLVNGAVQPYVNGSGNWRFADIQINAVAIVPAWLAPSSSSVNGGPAVWNYFTQTLTVNSGTATIISDPALSGDAPNIIVSGSATVLNINNSTGNTVNIGSLNVSGGATVAMISSAPNILIVPAGATFAISTNSKLNIGRNFLDLQASSSSQASTLLQTVNGLAATGYANGSWNGNGIDSSAAASNAAHLTAVGVIENNGIYGSGTGTLGLFDGVAPGQYDVLARYTWYGDANLSGVVDGSDYSIIDNTYTRHTGSGWANGDFNYDDAVDGSDYTLIDNAFNTQTTQLSAQIAEQTAQVATAGAATTSASNNNNARKPASVFAGSISPGNAAGSSFGSILDLARHDKDNSLVALLDGVQAS